MGERGRRRHHLGAGHVDAGVGLLLNGDEHVLDLVGGLGAVDRRIDDGVVHEQHVFLRAPIPGLGVAGELSIELMVGSERVHQRGLVVGRATHPAVGHARPLGDGIPLRDQLLARARGAEELVGVAARAGVGRRGQQVLGLCVVQRVVEPRDRARGVAKRGMRGHVLDALAVDIDLSAVAQAGEIFRARERPPLRADRVLGLRGTHGEQAPCNIAAARHSPGQVSMRRPGWHSPRISRMRAKHSIAFERREQLQPARAAMAREPFATCCEVRIDRPFA